MFRKKAISRLNLVLKLGLVSTTFFAIILLHLHIHSSKNYSLIILHVFLLISSIILSTNTPRMMNQSDQSTLQLMHFILTVQISFRKNCFIVLISYGTARLFTTKAGTPQYKRPLAENDQRPERGPGALEYYLGEPSLGRAAPSSSAFQLPSRYETAGPLPTNKTG